MLLNREPRHHYLHDKIVCGDSIGRVQRAKLAEIRARNRTRRYTEPASYDESSGQSISTS